MRYTKCWSFFYNRPRHFAAQSTNKELSHFRARPRLEQLEERTTPALFLTGVGDTTNPAAPVARLFDTATGMNAPNVVGPGDINAFPGFAGSVRVASGDVNGDGTDDIITAQGPGAGSGSQVRIFDGAAAVFNNAAREIASFFVYSNAAGATQTPGFGGGVFVAAADFNGDGFDELVTSPGAGARGHVKVFSFNGPNGFLGSNPVLFSSFFAYTDFAGEVRITTLRFSNIPFLFTASGAGTTPSDVRGYMNVHLIGQVPDGGLVPPLVQHFPFAGYTGGVSVAAGDTDLDGNDELFVSKNNGPSDVRVFDIANVLLNCTTTPAPSREFRAFDGFLGEVRLGVADVDGDGRVEVLTAAGSHVKAWNAAPAMPIEVFSFFPYPGFNGGVFLSTTSFTFLPPPRINPPVPIIALPLPNDPPDDFPQSPPPGNFA